MRRRVQLSFDAEHPDRLVGFWCQVLGYRVEPLPADARGARGCRPRPPAQR